MTDSPRYMKEVGGAQALSFGRFCSEGEQDVHCGRRAAANFVATCPTSYDELAGPNQTVLRGFGDLELVLEWLIERDHPPWARIVIRGHLTVENSTSR